MTHPSPAQPHGFSRPRRQALRQIGAATVALIFSSCARAQAQKTFSPEMFGARGDGRTDDYAAFVKLAAAVSGARGGLVRMGQGKNYLLNRYRVVGGAHPNDVANVAFNGCQNLTIDLNQSTIHVKGDFHRAGDLAGGKVSSLRGLIPLVFNRCTGLVVRNGSLNGNADKMTRDPKVAEADGHGIALNGCRNVLLQGLHVHHFSSDGVRAGFTKDLVHCQDVKLDRVRLTNNARQGFTNAGAIGVVATDSEFSETGRTGGTYSHAPSSGVDIEQLHEAKIRSDFRALRCRFDNNRGSVFVVGDPDRSSKIELIDCSSRNGSQKRLILAAEQVVIQGGTWHNTQIACAYGGKKKFTRTISIDVSGGVWTGDHPDWAPVYDINGQRPRVRIHGNRFELRPTRPFTSSSLFMCANPNHRFEGNQIFVSRAGHGAPNDDLIGNFQGAALVSGNKWSTDAKAPQRFVNNYRGAHVSGESFSGSFAAIGT